jgi:hypothetical protein
MIFVKWLDLFWNFDKQEWENYRKKDEEELIKIFKDKWGDNNNNEALVIRGERGHQRPALSEVEKIIKDYFNS